MKKKILITGSNGFIGKSLVANLIKTGKFELISPDSKMMNIIKKQNIFDINNDEIFHIVHLAAKTFVPDSFLSPEEYIDINTFGTKNILEYCRKNNISLTYISAYLYGQPEKLPISEDAPISPNNPYAFSKFMAEKMCEYYAEEFGVRVTVLRPFNIFGPFQNDQFLIPHIIKQALFSDEIIVQDLMPKRDYLYVEDLVDAIILSIEYKETLQENFNVFNVGSGYSMSVGEITETIQKLLKTDKKVISKNSIRKNEINNVIADISKLKMVLNWKMKYSFEQGLSRTISYYQGGTLNE